jgi:uncharacterized membrane-anchored protein YhcB (DUF1043 family)
MTFEQVLQLISALTGLVIAVGGFVVARRVRGDVQAVHTQLNSAKTAADQYQQDLRDALQEAGVTIPSDKSLRRVAEPPSGTS